MIRIRSQAWDDDNPNLWYFQFYGPDSVDNTVRLASTQQVLPEGETPDDWITANEPEAQSLVDAGVTNVFTVRQEAKNFIADNPGAKQLIELGPDDLETAIENRTENQETLLLKTLVFAVKVIKAIIYDASG